jgi:hypothetical protein
MIYQSKRNISMQKFYLKSFNKKQLWTFESLKIDNIFKSPYHNHFLMNFNVLFN